MADLTITRSGETMIFQVQGETEGGVEFVDGYMPPTADYAVVDSGRILLPDAAFDHLTEAAKRNGCSWGVV
jgi:hypothetical protein